MMRFVSLLAAAVLLITAPDAVQSVNPSSDCVAARVDVSKNFVKPALPINQTIAFDFNGVMQHFDSIGEIGDFRQNNKSTYSCVDSRGEVNELTTPGGDFAELSAAIQAYYNLTGVTKIDMTKIDAIFNAFMKSAITKDRPFYYHTSDEKLRKVFHHLAEEGISPKPTVFPEMMPTDEETQTAWLKALAMSAHQGCGHVRLMIAQPEDYGLNGPGIPKALVKSFYRFWWGTPVDSEERAKVNYQVMQGPLDAHALAVVNSEGDCPGHSPAIPPSHGGSQVFLYHAKAVDDFRKDVLTPFFVMYAKSKGKNIDTKTFYNKLVSVQGQHLGATLKLLVPANQVPLWSVSVKAARRK